MSFLNTIKARAGQAAYDRLDRAAEKEVALAMQMPLVDEFEQSAYYRPRFLMPDLLAENESFERAGLKILPADIVNVLFRCKLLFACKSEREYGQRRGVSSIFEGSQVSWTERATAVDALVEKYISLLETQIRERVLLSHVSSFKTIEPAQTTPREFFDQLFAALKLPFVCFFDDARLIADHQQLEPGLRAYDQVGAVKFFSASSIGHRASGSREYCLWYSSMWLRTLFNLIRVGGYIHPGQRSFGWDTRMNAPTYPVFLGDHAAGVLKYDQDKWECWAKIPDGCFFLSFGYRGISDMWLDRRTFPGIREFILRYQKIFSFLDNPWGGANLTDVAPILDILSSATQIPDMGAKVLLLYCCLEHLFVPSEARSENKKYIVGGLNAIGSRLLPWFNRLYDLRCAYAHKGFVPREEKTMVFVAESMENVMALLGAKLTTH